MDKVVQVSVSVNGKQVTKLVEPRQSLADFIRYELELTGTHVGCEHGVCGACTIRLDGRIVRACLTLAIQTDGCSVETIEGLTESGEIADLQEAFVTRNSAQCGFCTPGMLLTAAELLADNPSASRDEIREHISGNYCRCTGYQAVVDAIETAGQQRLGGGS
ncbi:MAG: (2Fe-2S)-binding protein [Rhodospirillaceae bacterium]|nr:(2Fe-2S)-binding protein [Rhodospirillaceae bacterium]